MAPVASSSDGTLTFAVASGSPGAEHHLAALCEELGRALSRNVEPRLLATYDALGEEVSAGRALIAWAPPLVAMELEGAKVASIALCCLRGGQTAYHSALFTRHDSTIADLPDLAGRHVAWVDAHSSAGYLVPRMRLASAGLDPTKLFGRESFLGTHERVACAVLEGRADVGATYLSLDAKTGAPESAGWLEAGAGLNGAFILATAGPIPADAIVLSSRLSEEVKEAVKTAMIGLVRTIPETVGGLLRAEGFSAPELSHFEGLRALRAAFSG